MNSDLPLARPRAFAPLQQFGWLHPEWWIVALCGLTASALLWHSWPRHGHDGHALSFADELLCWWLMVAAMMLPLVLGSIRTVATGSFWSRRHRAMAVFLTGYFVPWLVVGVAVAALRLGAWAHSPLSPVAAFAVAAAWPFTTWHRRALVECHRRLPLAPLGWPADRDCLRFGGYIGAACVASCWPLMVACTFAGHSLIALAGCFWIGTLERWSFRPRTRAALAVTLSLAAWQALLAGFRMD